MSRARLRNLALGLVSLVCLGFTGWVGYSLVFQPELYRVPIGGPFALEDLDGRPVTEADFSGGYLLVYFGYTYCPDFCPTELATMTQALETLEEASPARAARLTPLFVSLDPERDSPATLRAYMDHFHLRFRALTGSDEQIAAMADAYKVSYRRVPTEDGQDYLIDHTAYVFLIGPDGRYVTHFTPQEDAGAMSRRLVELIEAPG
ncbi:MAG: SCO family protein [Kiloniellales bacterium]